MKPSFFFKNLDVFGEPKQQGLHVVIYEMIELPDKLFQFLFPAAFISVIH